MELYNGQLKNYKFNIVKTHGSNNGKGYKSITRCYDIFVFDIENTNGYIEDGKVIPYRPFETDDYWNELKPVSLVYIWQFSVNDTVYYGRDLWDFLTLLDDLPKADLQIFVHNLNHEFSHLINILKPLEVFARSPHSPMKCTFEEYPHITFRCSYIMTNLSLENWGKQIGFYKKTGQLDYNECLRTPLTPITDIELEYCEYDCLVVYHGVLKELETYKTVFEIPITSTGKVREIVKDRLFEDKNYMYFIKRLVPTLDEYKLLLSAFQGGYCHCNKLHSGKHINDFYYDMLGLKDEERKVSHFDFSSSYPTVMVSEKYSTTPFRKRDRHDIVTNKNTRDKYSFIYKLKFTNLRSKNPHTYISANKCEYNGEITKDNGRVINCYGDLFITCFDTDFDIISWLYDWDKLTVVDSYYSYKDYLPRNFMRYILELYNDKTTLKGVKGQEDFYQLQKGRLNSLYGMCVTSLIPEDCELKGDEWVLSIPSDEEIKKSLSKMADKKKASKKYFLDFAWGCQVTSYARKNLFKCALGIDDKGNKHKGTHNGFDVCYFDTDSIFTIGNPDFKWYNDEITEKLKKACKCRDLNFEMTRPSDIKGVQHPLGIFDREDDIKEFKCLHAKCYLERRFDNKLYMTVSGINKNSVDCLLNNFNNFTDGFIFDKDDKSVRKLLATYCLDQPTITYPDGYTSRFKYGKNLRPIGYKISQTDEYKDLLRAYELKFDNLTSEQITTFRNGVII